MGTGYMLYILVISFMIIYFIHNIFNFLQTNLTNPLYKDVTNYQQKHYNEMYKVIGEKVNNKPVPPASKKDMKNELKDFLKEQMKSEQNYNSIQNAPLPFG
jgi:hypothetical protein